MVNERSTFLRIDVGGVAHFSGGETRAIPSDVVVSVKVERIKPDPFDPFQADYSLLFISGEYARAMYVNVGMPLSIFDRHYANCVRWAGTDMPIVVTKGRCE